MVLPVLAIHYNDVLEFLYTYIRVYYIDVQKNYVICIKVELASKLLLKLTAQKFVFQNSIEMRRGLASDFLFYLYNLHVHIY